MNSTSKFFLFTSLLLLSSVAFYEGISFIQHQSHIAKYRINTSGVPSTVYGPYVFIYDGIYESNPNKLQGGIPQWVIDNGSNIAILSFLDPVEVEESDVPPQVFLDSLVSAKNADNLYVMFSIGGWDFQNRFALTNPATVAKNAASMAVNYNVGIEIDCESDSQGAWITSFIKEFRKIIPIGGSNMSSVLTMDTGASPGAFMNVEAAAVSNINSLDWVNVMVNASDDASDNAMYWSQHKIAANKITVARNLVNVCNSVSNLAPTLTFQKDGSPVKGILFWAALSGATCDAASQYANNCGTTCTDCTGGVGTAGNWVCPAVTEGCETYGVCE